MIDSFEFVTMEVDSALKHFVVNCVMTMNVIFVLCLHRYGIIINHVSIKHITISAYYIILYNTVCIKAIWCNYSTCDVAFQYVLLCFLK